MTITYVIPSHARAGTLARKTMPLLAARGVPLDRVQVFVHEPEMPAYEAALADYPDVEVRPGALGMGANRNAITQAFDEGDRLVCVDDDLDDVIQRASDREAMPVADLHQLAVEAFGWAAQANAGLWGVYPVANPYFMRPKVTFDLRYIVGCLWGKVNSHDEAAFVTLDDKEDFERTIRYYLRDGTVMRIGYVAPVTKYYREPGGMQETRTEARVTESARVLAGRYPDLCQLRQAKSGHTELRLKDRRQRVAP